MYSDVYFAVKADTLKHTITTKRETHPLQPVYQDLDSGAPLAPIVAPLLPASIITRPSVRFPATTATAGGTQQRPQSGSILGQSASYSQGLLFGGGGPTSARERPRSGNDLLGKGSYNNNSNNSHNSSSYVGANNANVFSNQMPLFSAPVNLVQAPALNFDMFQQAPSQRPQPYPNLNLDMFQLPGESKSFASKFEDFDTSGTVDSMLP